MRSLQGRRILVVEDEYLLAADLSRYLANMGATILGPAPTIAAAEIQVPRADAAVLDIDLGGCLVFPVADKLSMRGVPFIFFTGHNDIVIPDRFRYVSQLSKPVNREALFSKLFAAESPMEQTVTAVDDVIALLPKLRLSARLIMGDELAADRLVELTLEHAIEILPTKYSHVTTEDWLSGLLEEAHFRWGSSLMH